MPITDGDTPAPPSPQDGPPAPNDSSDSGGRAPTVLRVIFAIIIGVAFAWFVIFLMGQVTSDNEIWWGRRIFLFGAVEAIAFTAIGWVFGREVHREQAARADAATADAKKAAEDAAAAGASGRALRDAIQAKADNAGPNATQVAALLFSSQEPPETDSFSPLLTTDIDELADLARRLFPN